MAKHSSPARGICQRGNSYWLTYQEGGKRTRASLETDTFAEAVRRAAILRAHPMLAPGDGLSGDIKRFFAAQVARKKYTAASVDSKQPVLLKFAQWAEDIPTASVTAPMLQK